MRTFLQQIIAELKSDYGKDISELCIVVPTRRAVEFLREAIREEYRESIWAPKMLSIQDFVRGISGREFPETMPLVFELYKVYLDRMREDNASFYESLESFYAWGEMLVKDFDEIDKYLVNAGDLRRSGVDVGLGGGNGLFGGLGLTFEGSQRYVFRFDPPAGLDGLSFGQFDVCDRIHHLFCPEPFDELSVLDL